MCKHLTKFDIYKSSLVCRLGAQQWAMLSPARRDYNLIEQQRISLLGLTEKGLTSLAQLGPNFTGLLAALERDRARLVDVEDGA